MSISLAVDSVEKFNLSLQQNYVPIINSIQVVNEGELDFESLKLVVSSEPPELIAADITLSLLRASETKRMVELKERYSLALLDTIQERVRGGILVEVFDSEGEKRASAYVELIVEPKNVWLGQAAPLELLCAYIQPNAEVVQPVLRRASELLKESTGDSAISGYQISAKGRVYQTAQAIYLALREKNIAYAQAPASFEHQGQKVRQHGSLIEDGVGNCLDITLMYAACLEQAGIYPLIFLIEGHAFVGFWLEEKFLQRSLEEDAQFFRKRIELEEITALNIVGLSSERPLSFSELIKDVNAMFEAEEKFEVAIDVMHCRKIKQIHPINDGQKSDLLTEQREDRDTELFIENKKFDDFEMPETVVSRSSEVEKWKDKLLDLSFRNRLLNFKSYRSTVRILCESPSEMENWLADGSVFELLPEPIEEEVLRKREDAAEVFTNQVKEHFERKELLTNLSPDKFSGILTGLYRSVVNAEEETGANTLFLALGVLAWTESEISEVERKSPLLLLPVHLQRKSVGGKFHLSQRGEDTVLNATLLQKLKRDFDLTFPGLDTLPLDESGVDVDKIFNIIKRVIKDRRGWEVRKEVWLSEFSFQKFLMWKELDESYTEMLGSPVVKRIMTSEKIDTGGAFVREHEVEEYANPTNTYCPLSADSSQMAAILSAAKGKSFVLQGPPGTGKSQTIANMISHLIGVGKKVLFVSEKKVALEVVYKRLKDIGIGQFCLELHSKKSEKKEVIKSFLESLEFNRGTSDVQWVKSSSQLTNSRTDLNKYFAFLHKKGESGVSAYRAFVNASRKSPYPKIDLDLTEFIDYPAGQIIDLENDLQKWVNQTLTLSNQHFDVWSKVALAEWSTNIQDNGTVLLNKLIDQLDDVEGKLIDFPLDIRFLPEWPIERIHSLISLSKSLLNMPEISPGFLEVDQVERYFIKTREAFEVLNTQKERKHAVMAVFDKSIFSEPFFLLHKMGTEALEANVIIQWWKKYNLQKEVKPYLRQTKVSTEELLRLFEIGRDYQDCVDQERSSLEVYEAFTGMEYSMEDEIISDRVLSWAQKLLKTISSLYPTDIEGLEHCKLEVKNALKNASHFTQKEGVARQQIEQLIDHLEVVVEHARDLEHLLKIKLPLNEMSISASAVLLKNLSTSVSNLRDVVAFNVLRNHISSQGLNPLFKALDDGKFDRNEILEVFSFNFHRQCLTALLQSEEKLNNVTGNQLNGWDKAFKAADKKYMELTKSALVSKISEDKPKLGEMVIPDTPVGLIVKEGKKSRGHMSIRKFLAEIEPVSKALKPCYLMSPMSVSQYLPVKPDFDVVIFDEASQIPPWDAIGSLARGTQAVVVGDTKQLPPTSFFSNRSEDENDEKIDCESVLEMFGSMFPELLLKWHYRSRSESLIGFSNYHIYDNRLHTFPSFHTNDNKVSLKVLSFKEAYYDRGKSRCNRGEARAVTDEIFRRLRSKGQSNSIGVVTFSSVQASLISDMIDEMLQQLPEFEKFFDTGNANYIFVKNLENVQGDERDTILFSVGYGNDLYGRIAKNFGPLNNPGGERRLNVAITRAREDVMIFCNFEPRDFDINGSKALGLKLLKEYLLYAKNGKEALLMSQIVDPNDTFDSIFEQQVAEKLRERGWKVNTQVGVGGYRIDLGIVHPEHQGSFLAGVECDGARYHSAKTARDRDILRQSVLEGLGWNILRIWSTDWWNDSHACLDKLEDSLNQFLTSYSQALPEVEEVEEPVHSEESNDLEETPEEPELKEILYYNENKVNLKPKGDFFENSWLIKLQIKEVIKELAPISRIECFSLVRKAWDFARMGRRMESYLDSCTPEFVTTSAYDKIFYWNSKEQLSSINELRLPIPGSLRHPSTIAPEELTHGLLMVMNANFMASRDQLFKQVMKLLGYSRVPKDSMEYLMPALEILIKGEKLNYEDGVVSLPKKS